MIHFQVLSGCIIDETDTISKWEHKWRIKTNEIKTSIFLKPHENSILTTFTSTPLTHCNHHFKSHTLYHPWFNLWHFHFHLHVSSKATIAWKTLHSLYRFKWAAPHLKLHLYKIIKPVLIYTSFALSQTNANSSFYRIKHSDGSR